MKRRRRARRRIGARHIPAILLCLAAAALLVWFLLTNYVFVVRSTGVQLPENSRYTPQQVMQQSGLKLGTRMDRIDEAAIAQNLQDTGWLVLEDIQLQYPGHVVLAVSERRPAAMVSHVSTLIITDAQGIMIEQVKGDPGYDNCVYVTDMDIRRAQPGHALQPTESKRFEALTALLQGLEEVPCHDLIGWVTMEDPRDLRMYATNHVWVELGDSDDMADKLRWTEAALTDLIARGEKLGTLNVASGKHADYSPGD